MIEIKLRKGKLYKPVWPLLLIGIVPVLISIALAVILASIIGVET